MILQFLLIVEKETLKCSMRSTCNKKQAIAIHKVSQLQITMFNVCNVKNVNNARCETLNSCHV